MKSYKAYEAYKAYKAYIQPHHEKHTNKIMSMGECNVGNLLNSHMIVGAVSYCVAYRVMKSRIPVPRCCCC